MSVSVEQMADEIAKMLTEYEAERRCLWKSRCKRRRKAAAADQPQKNR